MVEAAPTLGLLLSDARARLESAGVSDPAREALRIWADLTGRRPGDAVTFSANTVAPDLAERLDRAFVRRASGEPLAYVTGIAGFRHLDLVSDARALIPRPETEGLVDLLLARARTGRVADVGTGTGCIALSLALEGHFSDVVAIDRSRAALELAAENAVRAVAGIVRFVAGDLVSGLADASLDALVSNPPYLSASEYAALDGAVRDWEPALALVSGDDGMDATAALLQDGRRVVAEGGWIVLEVDCSRATAAAEHASALGWRDVAVEADLFGRERYLLARRSATP